MDLFGCRRPRLISVQLPVAIIIIHTLTLQQVVVDLAKRFISKVISRKSAAINCYFSAVVFALLALFVCHPTFAQVDRCSRDIPHLSANERITYKAYYNWKFIWLRAADILFTSNDTSYNNVPAHHFLAEGRSLKEYDLFFKVRDRFESIVAKEVFDPFTSFATPTREAIKLSTSTSITIPAAPCTWRPRHPNDPSGLILNPLKHAPSTF